MTSLSAFLCLLIIALSVTNSTAQGISSVTRKTYKSPNPGFVVPQTPPPAANAAAAAPRPAPVIVYTIRPKKSQAALNSKVVEFQKTRAAEGATYAQYELGMRYLTGNGVDQDEKAGREWLKKAAESGHLRAARKLQELDTPTVNAAPAPTKP